MRVEIMPGERSGDIRIPASKSQAHRLLICAALGKKETEISCDGISRDIAATMACLNALGADIEETAPGRLHVRPIGRASDGLCRLACGESGSTLRFLLPLVGALGAEAVFYMEGRLPERPLAPLDAELKAHGMTIRQEGALLYCGGRLSPGVYSLPGNVSSQYISGLLMSLPILPGDSSLCITGDIESSAYITMTEDALALSRVSLEKNKDKYHIPGNQRASLPECLAVEGDYSNAAFFLCMGALSERGIAVSGLLPQSHQGDRAVIDILRRFGAEIEEREGSFHVRRGKLKGCLIDAAPIPDLIPVLSVVASGAEGETRVIHAGRLRLKESDRLSSTTRMLKSLGADITELEDGLVIHGRPKLCGGTVDSCGDHRIAMAAAVAACLCDEMVAIEGSEAVNKSYPRFWEDFGSLTGGRT